MFCFIAKKNKNKKTKKQGKTYKKIKNKKTKKQNKNPILTH